MAEKSCVSSAAVLVEKLSVWKKQTSEPEKP